MDFFGKPSCFESPSPPTWLEVCLKASVWLSATGGRDGHEVVRKALCQLVNLAAPTQNRLRV